MGIKTEFRLMVGDVRNTLNNFIRPADERRALPYRSPPPKRHIAFERYATQIHAQPPRSSHW